MQKKVACASTMSRARPAAQHRFVRQPHPLRLAVTAALPTSMYGGRRRDSAGKTMRLSQIGQATSDE
jgi:hypothetical protein